MNLSVLSHDALVSELLAPIPESLLRPRLSEVPLSGCEAALAYKLGVARELLMRELKTSMRNQTLLNSPQILQDWARLYCKGLEHEVFLVLYLSSGLYLIEAVELFRGTVSEVIPYPREILKGALAHNAHAVVVCHNHPSGRIEASQADTRYTATLKAALQLVDIRLIDHVIVAGDQTLSFAQRALL